MKDLRNQLLVLGLDTRFALDIGSVVSGIRPRGLMHVPSHQVAGTERLLGSLGLKLIASRPLFGRKDPSSREGVLTDQTTGNNAAAWAEIWFASRQSAAIDASELFENPGRHLGYPDCCCLAMQKEDPLASLYFAYLQSGATRHWKLNRLAALFHPTILMPDFFPCSLACRAALEFVEPFTDLADGILPEHEVQEAKAAMRAPITLISEEIIHWPAWRLESGSLYLQSSRAKKEHISAVSTKLEALEPGQCALVMFDHLLQEGWGHGDGFVHVESLGREAIRLQPSIR